jgi:hypothetical protein
MKAVQRMSNAWRRFLFGVSPVAGCLSSLRIVIFHSADSAHRGASGRAHGAAGRP